MSAVSDASYLVASVLFILGIMRLRNPATARSGNTVAILGLVFALLGTFALTPTDHLLPVVLVAILGAVGGTIFARRVPITAMPQAVALFNGMGGAAAALVAAAEVLGSAGSIGVAAGTGISASVTVLIGSISASGSVIAFMKLQELLPGRPLALKGHALYISVLLGAAVMSGVALTVGGGVGGGALALLAALSLAFGLLLALPVGGADMPVLISLLNSLTGLAAAATGFLLGNNVLVTAGALVGASGTILTQVMSRSMNRPISRVLFGALAQATGRTESGAGPTGTVRSADADDVALLLGHARRVIVVPGFGLAVARAQQEVRELSDRLEARKVDVRFAIHPVAGRMPGHMNVLLAEANVPYERLYDMDQINGEFAQTDVALVIGANDVTNPAARNDPKSPLFGMPVLNVDRAQTVIVLKRSMNPGFAGVDNPLYLDPKTLMLFGDAKDSLGRVIKALEEV